MTQLPGAHCFREFAAQYRTALLQDVIPFWQRHSPDYQAGGYFTCLDRDGSVYDTDKFVWLQARQVWTFSMLYSRLEQRPEWLELAQHGLEFLKQYGRDEQGDWYFSLTREGRPLVQPYNIFSDCFAAMAFSQYAQATGEEEPKRIALATYQRIWQRKDNPKGKYSKAVPGTRPLKSFALPMILSNLTLELEWLLEKSEVEMLLRRCVDEVMTQFVDAQRLLVFEHIAPDGSHPDCFEGRLINPGHAIEGMWFLMEIGRRWNDQALIARCIEVMLASLEFGWDQEHGGIYAFLDAKGAPTQQLEWDQKLWWAQLEGLVGTALAFALTGRPDCWEWYQRLHEYAWSHFPDPEYGEWYGYLNRRGEVLLSLKGGKWKGCYHLPRSLYLCANIFENLAKGAASACRAKT